MQNKACFKSLYLLFLAVIFPIVSIIEEEFHHFVLQWLLHKLIGTILLLLKQ